MAERQRDMVPVGEAAVFRPGEEQRAPVERGAIGLSVLQGRPAWVREPVAMLQRVATHPEELTTGQVLGLSVGAAAAVGGLYLALEPEPAPPLPRPVERAIRQLPREQRRQARQAAYQAGTTIEEARHRAVATASGVAERFGEAASAGRARVGQTIATVGSAIATSGATLADAERAGAASAPATLVSRKERRRAAKEEAKRARQARDAARRQGRAVAGQARESARQAGERVGETLAAVGGALAGAGSAVAERVKPEEKGTMSALRDTLDTTTARGRTLTRRGRKNIERQLKQLDKQSRRLRKQAGARAKDARKQLAKTNVPASLDAARETVATGADTLGKTLASVGAATASLAAPLLERARSGGPVEQARDTAAQVVDATRERATELTGRVRDELLPKVREEYVPQVVETATRTGARVGELAVSGLTAGREALREFTTSEPLERAGELADQAGKATREAAGEAGKVARRTGDAVATATGRALSATGNATKETFLIVGWAAALGGVVYYGILNDEQRAKVTGAVQSFYEQARELVRDFQGYDEEF